LRNDVCIGGADEKLNGGAAWTRLLAEIEVAMRLTHPNQEELERLAYYAIRCGGTGVHGHQRWEDVSSKLMLTIAFDPLRSRIRYIAARIAWMLRHQKVTVTERMATLSEGPAARFHSPLFAQHLGILRSSAIARDLVFSAYDGAASRVAEGVLKNLQSTLTAGCINPNIMLRPKTEPDMDPAKLTKPTEEQMLSSGRTAAARQRVKDEMELRDRRRSGRSGGAAVVDEYGGSQADDPAAAKQHRLSSGLPLQLRDKIFEPSDVVVAMPFVEAELRRSFSVLARVLATQAFAFADTAMLSLCQRGVDEAMAAIDFTPEQRCALGERHVELQEITMQVEKRLTAVRRCTTALRRVRAVGGV
jgi:hypothetical protein